MIATYLKRWGVFALLLFGQTSRAQPYIPKGDYAFRASKIRFHLVNDDQPLQNAEVEETKKLAGPTFIPHKTPVPAQPHPIEVAESQRAYTDGRFADAAAAVAAVAEPDPAAPDVLFCRARALYRLSDTGRQRSYPVFLRLIKLLDDYGREDEHTVAVYTQYLEAYFKVATLQLDEGEWPDASYNLSRAALALSSMQASLTENRVMHEQILQYQTECFANLNKPELCRYFGTRTLKLFPKNKYVRPYLAKLPQPRPTTSRR